MPNADQMTSNSHDICPCDVQKQVTARVSLCLCVSRGFFASTVRPVFKVAKISLKMKPSYQSPFFSMHLPHRTEIVSAFAYITHQDLCSLPSLKS